MQGYIIVSVICFSSEHPANVDLFKGTNNMQVYGEAAPEQYCLFHEFLWLNFVLIN